MEKTGAAGTLGTDNPEEAILKGDFIIQANSAKDAKDMRAVLESDNPLQDDLTLVVLRYVPQCCFLRQGAGRSNFGGLVLGFIEADVWKYTLISKLSPRSTVTQYAPLYRS